MAPPTVVLVGSTNPVKVNSTRLAFEACFPSQAFAVVGVPGVQSGVPDQPMGDAETKLGALNRARSCAARARQPAAGLWPEGGVVRFAVGLEGGLLALPVAAAAAAGAGAGGAGGAAGAAGGLECFAVMAILAVDGGGGGAPAGERWGLARTASFPLPPRLCALVAGGMELGDADDAVFGRSNSKQGDGTVGILSHGLVDRTEYYRHALVLALVPFTNPGLYFGEEQQQQ